MTDYTPGPWKWYPENNDWLIKPENKGFAIAAALSCFDARSCENNYQERNANAELIASAPRLKQERDDLLGGLKKISNLTDYWKGSAVVTAVSSRYDIINSLARELIERIES